MWRVLPTEHQVSQRFSLDLDRFNDFPGTHYVDVVQLAERAIAVSRGERA
jgi:hypothetical protein